MKDNKNKLGVKVIAGVLAFIMIAVAVGAAISIILAGVV